MGPENDLMELLWRDGQVVTHNQSQIKHELAPAIHGDEFASWFQGDSVDYGSNVTYEISTANVGTDLRLLNGPREERVMNGMNGIRVEVGSSILTEESNCESNHVENVAISSHDLSNAGNHGSGGSEFSFGRTDQRNKSNQSHKRKMRNGEEPEHHIQDADESTDAYKSARRSSSSAGRSRTAEIHNLSERRRRDRINGKMRALQELVPNCNREQNSDKAKLLDDAIEYLKSLQLQIQTMWRGSGIAPLMFPGAQNYIPSIGVSTGYAPFHGLVQLQGGVVSFDPSSAAGLMSPMQMVPSQHIDPVLLKHKQNTCTTESYARDFNHMKPPPQDHVTGSAASCSCLPTCGKFGPE